MTSKPKALGLALCAVFAMGAIGASTASAEGVFHAAGEPAFLTANGISGEQQFTTTVGEFACNEVTAKTVIAKTATEIKAAPTYSDCEAKMEEAEFKVEVDFTSCYYLFTSTLQGEHAPTHIECADEDEIHFDLVIFETTFPCIRVPAQTPTSGGAAYTNHQASGVKDIEIDLTMSGIQYTEVAFSVCNPASTVVAQDGVYSGRMTVSGYSDVAHTKSTSVWWE